jgi:hypothetical protein
VQVNLFVLLGLFLDSANTLHEVKISGIFSTENPRCTRNGLRNEERECKNEAKIWVLEKPKNSFLHQEGINENFVVERWSSGDAKDIYQTHSFFFFFFLLSFSQY